VSHWNHASEHAKKPLDSKSLQDCLFSQDSQTGKETSPFQSGKIARHRTNLTDSSSAQVVWESTMSVLSSCLHEIESLQSRLEVVTRENAYMRSMHEISDFLNLYFKSFAILAMQKERLRIGEYHCLWESQGGLDSRNYITKDVEAKILEFHGMKLMYSYHTIQGSLFPHLLSCHCVNQDHLVFPTSSSIHRFVILPSAWQESRKV
jgi:hypothetical protein